MQRQQSCTRKCVHVITDLAHVGEKSDGKKKEKRERKSECKTSTGEIMYIKKTQQEKRLKSKLGEFKRIFDVYQKRKAALRLGRQ